MSGTKTYRYCPDRGCVTDCPEVPRRRGMPCRLAATCLVAAEPRREFKGAARPGDTPYGKPIEMFSVAPETPGQLADLRRQCPNVEFTDQNVPIARNLQEKKAILAATDFHDLR